VSTGFECLIFEAKPGEWYYALQNWSCPVGADWTSDCSVTGPFPTADAVEAHIGRYEANPGGWNERDYDATRPNQFSKLVAQARRPQARTQGVRSWR
jgi:hypothetical protein